VKAADTAPTTTPTGLETLRRRKADVSPHTDPKFPRQELQKLKEMTNNGESDMSNTEKKQATK
jgi:hypothetical protein